MPELLKFIRKIREDLYIEFSYRLNFDGDKSCGYSKVFSADPGGVEEPFELYAEVYPCGMSEKEVMEKLNSLIQEIETGKLDLEL